MGKMHSGFDTFNLIALVDYAEYVEASWAQRQKSACTTSQLVLTPLSESFTAMSSNIPWFVSRATVFHQHSKETILRNRKNTQRPCPQRLPI
jgi:hypothetical protein